MTTLLPCPECGSDEADEIPDRPTLWECSECGHPRERSAVEITCSAWLGCRREQAYESLCVGRDKAQEAHYALEEGEYSSALIYIAEAEGALSQARKAIEPEQHPNVAISVYGRALKMRKGKHSTASLRGSRRKTVAAKCPPVDAYRDVGAGEALAELREYLDDTANEVRTRINNAEVERRMPLEVDLLDEWLGALIETRKRVDRAVKLRAFGANGALSGGGQQP